MKLIQRMILVSLLALGSLGVNLATAKDISTANNPKAEMNSQQELITLFFAAAKTGNQEVIEEFLKHGFPVDVRNAEGYTALMMAAYYGHQPIVTTLLKQGADRCARDKRGNTALMGALFKMEFSIAKQLSQVDCDVAAKKQGLKTTEDFAKVIGQMDRFKQLLKQE